MLGFASRFFRRAGAGLLVLFVVVISGAHDPMASAQGDAASLDADVTICVVVDLTASSQSDFALVQEQLLSVANLGDVTTVGYSLVGFSDYPVAPFGFSNDVAYREIVTGGTATDFEQAVASLPFGQGGDPSEAQLDAVVTAVGPGVGDCSWEQGAQRILVATTDSLCHAPDGIHRFSVTETTDVLVSTDTTFVGLVDGVDATECFAPLAAATGGALVQANDQSADVSAVVGGLIDEQETGTSVVRVVAAPPFEAPVITNPPVADEVLGVTVVDPISTAMVVGDEPLVVSGSNSTLLVAVAMAAFALGGAALITARRLDEDQTIASKHAPRNKGMVAGLVVALIGSVLSISHSSADVEAQEANDANAGTVTAADFAPATPAANALGADYFDKTDRCRRGAWQVHDQDLVPGFYYADCDIELFNSSGTLTLASTGQIRVRGDSRSYTSFHDSLLFISDSTKSNAVDAETTNSTFAGTIATPNAADAGQSDDPPTTGGVDADGDTFDSVESGGPDCDDGDKGVNPDAIEDPSTTDIDENCDGLPYDQADSLLVQLESEPFQCTGESEPIATISGFEPNEDVSTYWSAPGRSGPQFLATMAADAKGNRTLEWNCDLGGLITFIAVAASGETWFEVQTSPAQGADGECDATPPFIFVWARPVTYRAIDDTPLFDLPLRPYGVARCLERPLGSELPKGQEFDAVASSGPEGDLFLRTQAGEWVRGAEVEVVASQTQVFSGFLDVVNSAEQSITVRWSVRDEDVSAFTLAVDGTAVASIAPDARAYVVEGLAADTFYDIELMALDGDRRTIDAVSVSATTSALTPIDRSCTEESAGAPTDSARFDTTVRWDGADRARAVGAVSVFCRVVNVLVDVSDLPPDDGNTVYGVVKLKGVGVDEEVVSDDSGQIVAQFYLPHLYGAAPGAADVKVSMDVCVDLFRLGGNECETEVMTIDLTNEFTDSCANAIADAIALGAPRTDAPIGYVDFCARFSFDTQFHIGIADLADPRTELGVMIDGDGARLPEYELRSLPQHVSSFANGSVIAINGGTWIGDKGLSAVGRFLDPKLNGNTPEGSEGERPAWTMIVEGETIYENIGSREAMIGFNRDSSGAAFFLNASGPGLPEFGDYGWNVIGSTTSIMVDGVCRARGASRSFADQGLDGRYAALGISDSRVVFLSTGTDSPATSDHQFCEVFAALGVDAAIRLDGASAAGMYADVPENDGERHVNQLQSISDTVAFGRSRDILSAIGVRVVE